MPAEDSFVGSVVEDRYKIRGLLGKGGMGAVYAATHLKLDRAVAVKLMHPSFATDEAAVARFLREARAAARVEHANAVKVYDFGSLPDGSVYLVMEMLNGVSLRDVLRRHGRLSLKQAADVVRQAGAALGAAHAQAVVHRDVKPENIVVQVDGAGRARVTLVDFGLAKLIADVESQVTHASQLVGTPRYMAPEQFTGGDVDHRADIYALGIVLYEMLAGRAPFEGTISEIIGKHLHAPPPPVPDLPDALTLMLARALSKTPGGRYQSTAELAADLDRVAGSEPAQWPPLADPAPATVDVAGATPSSLSTVPPAAATNAQRSFPVLDVQPTPLPGAAADEETRLRAADPPTVVVPEQARLAALADKSPTAGEPAARRWKVPVAAGAIVLLMVASFRAFNSPPYHVQAPDAGAASEAAPPPPAPTIEPAPVASDQAPAPVKRSSSTTRSQPSGPASSTATQPATAADRPPDREPVRVIDRLRDLRDKRRADATGKGKSDKSGRGKDKKKNR